MKKRVILADDNATYRETMIAGMERFCDKEGIDVEFDEVADGKELVERVRRDRYDLVFTDNQMTEVHGLQALGQIREHDKTVPIYMLSSSEVGEQALKLGANGYFDKRDYDAFKSGVEKALRTHLK